MQTLLLPGPLCRHIARCCALLCAAIFASSALAAGLSAPTQPVVQTEQVRAELVAHAPQGVSPSSAEQTIWLGLLLEHQEHWHTYWKNPGDSGLATELQWQLPAGWTAGDIEWPQPQRIPVGTMVNLGYEGRVLLPTPIHIAPQWRPPLSGSVKIGLHARWLVCRQECIPQEGDFTLQLSTNGSTALHSADFEQAQATTPRTAQQLGLNTQAQATVLAAQGQNPAQLQLTVRGLPAAWQGQELMALPEQSYILDTPSLPPAGNQHWEGHGKEAVWQARITLSPMRLEAPQQLDWIIHYGQTSLRLQSAVTGAWPAVTTEAPANSTASAPTPLPAPTPTPAPDIGAGQWSILLLSALLGGLILNLMPCVLPVLAIKALSLAQADTRVGTASPWQRGVAYTAGVVLSMLALAGVLLALRAGGEQLGWGFQLQNPWVVGGLAVLFALLTANLAGWWEPRFLALLSGRSSAVELPAMRHPWLESAWSGMLAVAVASPCTAPFMGVALGTALTLPAAAALAVFATLGLGLALPFGLLSAFPHALRWLPRPGRWMLHLRRVLALPLLATVLWLLWVLWQLLAPMHPTANDTNAQGAWQTWSAEREALALASGQPVFVDYTAAWCITCQVNERTTLNQSTVQQAFRQRGVLLLRADWTRQDPAITQALHALGRSGVPVYVLHPGKGRPPIILSELLTPGQVLESLARLDL